MLGTRQYMYLHTNKELEEEGKKQEEHQKWYCQCPLMIFFTLQSCTVHHRKHNSVQGFTTRH